MNKKYYKSLALIIIFVALIGIYFWVNKTNKVEYEDITQNEKAIELTKINRIKISNLSHGTKYDLIYDASEWWVEGDPRFIADQQPIRETLALVDRMSKDNLVSSNKEKEEVFGVGEGRGTLVEFFNDENELLLKLYIGKPTLDGDFTYIKYNDEDDIYIEQGNIPFLIWSYTPVS